MAMLPWYLKVNIYIFLCKNTKIDIINNSKMSISHLQTGIGNKHIKSIQKAMA